jgi:hypothetical protein
MGIDAKTFEQIKLATNKYRGSDCLILGDTAFYMPGMTLESFSAECGFRSAATIDIHGNPTIKADLQNPPSADLLGKFGVIIDAGTLCCCFDIAGVWRNLLKMLAPSGVIFHQGALSGYFGRIYYSFQPSLFRDFYRSNGFDIERICVRTPRLEDDDYKQISIDDVFSLDSSSSKITFGKNFKKHITVMPADMTIMCVASRKSASEFKNAIPVYYATS